MQKQIFSKGTSALLDKVFYNLPAVVFTTTILIRLLVAVPIAIVSVMKFQFLGEIAAMAIGILSVLLLETLLTVLSLINANFRKYDLTNEANFLFGLIIFLMSFNAYLLQSITQFYEIPYKLTALLTLHVLNVVSVLLIESTAYVATKTEIAARQNQIAKQRTEIAKQETEISEKPNFTKEEFPELVLYLKKNYTQKRIAAFLQVSESAISRISTPKTT